MQRRWQVPRLEKWAHLICATLNLKNVRLSEVLSVREACVSRHNDCRIEGLPYTPRYYITAVSWGFQEGHELGSHGRRDSKPGGTCWTLYTGQNYKLCINQGYSRPRDGCSLVQCSSCSVFTQFSVHPVECSTKYALVKH